MVGDTAQARRTKKIIRQSLVELLDVHGLDDITMGMLAEAADVNRSTIYRYYSSLFDVLGDCIYEIAGKADERIPSAATREDFMGQVRQTVENSYRGIRDNRGLYSFMERSPKTVFCKTEHVAVVEEHSASYYRGLVDGLLDLGVHLIVPRRCLEITLGRTSGAVVQYWIESGFRETPEEMADITVRLFEKSIEALSSVA